MKRLILIFSVCLLSLALHAQNEYGKVSPQTADFIKYGNIPVSLYTGQVSVSVPLYHIEDPDFDIPLILNYASDGFKPNKRAGFAGLNWSLSGTGTITREIYGVPDDFKEYETSLGATKGFWQAVKLHPYNQDDIFNFAPGILKDWGNYCTLPQINNCFYDSEPDLFNFVMPGHSGSFMIDNQGKLCANNKGYKIDFSGFTAQTALLDYPLDSQIKITAPDGYVYTFGGSLNSLEFNMNCKPGYGYTPQQKQSRINAWHLTSITAPNGRKLTVNYVNPLDTGAQSPFWFSSRDKKLTATPGDPYTYQATKVVFPESIVVEDTGLRIEFMQSIETCQTFYKESQNYNNRSYQLDGIRVKQDGTTVYTWQLAYENKQHLRFLKEVVQPDGGTYTFEYLHASEYPEYNTKTVVDDFGYWKGASSGIPQAFSLMSQVTYPTGGCTLFTYEPHFYRQRVDTKVTNTSYAANLVRKSGRAGGFRIKKCEDRYKTALNTYSKKSKTYTYATPNTSDESGILLKYRPYTLKANGDTVFIWNDVWTRNYNIEEPHMGYSYVKETLDDGSCIQYKFSDYQTCPDMGSVAYHWIRSIPESTPLSLVSGNATRAASKYSQRGYLLKKSIYNGAGVEQQCIEYTYRQLGFTFQPVPDPSLPEASPGRSVSLRPVAGGAMAMLIKQQTYPLIIEKTTTYFPGATPVVLTKKYAYNAYDQLLQQTENTSMGGTLKTTFSYPTDLYVSSNAANLYTRLVSRNIVNRVIEENHYLGGKLLKGKKRTPKILVNNDVVDASVSARKGSSAYEEHERYEVYDAYGNPVYVVSYQGRQKVLIWGYKGRYLIAGISGVTYSKVSKALGSSPESYSSRSIPDMAKLDSLRSKLPAALITTYTYEPLVGITSHTAPNGEKTTYEYNDKKQLSAVKNHDGKVIKTYTYHYQTSKTGIKL